MDDDGGPDRSAAAEGLSGDETDDESCGQDRINAVEEGDHATVVDLLDYDSDFGREGAESIHHVVVRVPKEERKTAR